MGVLLMEYGLECYSTSGILQFDTDFSQYALSKVLTGLSGATHLAYTATDRHLLVAYAPSGYLPALPSVMWKGGNNYEVDASKNYSDPVMDSKILVFEPFKDVINTASMTGVGLECYDSTGKVTYSTNKAILRVKAVHVLPTSNTGNNLYGTGQGVVSTTEYVWKTSIASQDVTDFGVFFAQQRLGNLVEYDNSSIVINIFEQPRLSISSDGYLQVSFKGIEGFEVDYGAAFSSVLTYITYGTQIAYIVDVSAFKNTI